MSQWFCGTVSVTAANGVSRRTKARVLSSDDGGQLRIGYPLFVGFLLLTSILVPPLLLLNMPILIGRSAFVFWRHQALAKKTKAVLEAFHCHSCSEMIGPLEETEALPQRVECSACRASHRIGTLEEEVSP